MELALFVAKTCTGYDVRITNKSNKSRGISGWNMSEEGARDMVRQLIQLAAEIQSKIDFKDSK